MIFFTADLHFNHANIIKYCNRPFESIEQMNETIIEKWNKKVSTVDKVYILGDFTFREPEYFLDKLNGNKALIIGDHDRATTENDEARYLFAEKVPLLNLIYGGVPITLCHWCMRVWAKSHYNSWHLYGHSHGRLSPIGKSWDVGVDNNNFEPLSFLEIKSIMEKQPDNFNFIKRNEKL